MQERAPARVSTIDMATLLGSIWCRCLREGDFNEDSTDGNCLDPWCWSSASQEFLSPDPRDRQGFPALCVVLSSGNRSLCYDGMIPSLKFFVYFLVVLFYMSPASANVSHSLVPSVVLRSARVITFSIR